MTDRSPLHDDRRRAGSFGAAAARYDDHRPRYPREVIAHLVDRPGLRVLDVGAGTGIASVQLAEAGADVLAVEPDPQMAELAAAKGIAVEVATFEEWEPGGRRFDLVVFAQSFHWVRPEPAVAAVAGVLDPGGRLALLWNRITSVRPTRAEFDRAYAGLLDDWQRPSAGLEVSPELDGLLTGAGFAVEHREVVEDLHYGAEQWVDMVTTYSNVLTLPAADRDELRARLLALIPDDGVAAVNRSLAVVGTLG
ncbi:methyltransferase domain-containing protein [Mycolicibacterium grossiae]|uniref:Methyltransferase type 12 n=1 Tax=Mycolicibacterium grossiae TaxID=1552759 RepID=A0A1E8PXV2_9MYCO|nr:methyltransferase type 12 [Mycolicibacterium grossiae]QEM44923.1 methyltransferase domain-containing protein [Mycolicibacterium grossiae]